MSKLKKAKILAKSFVTIVIRRAIFSEIALSQKKQKLIEVSAIFMSMNTNLKANTSLEADTSTITQEIL